MTILVNDEPSEQAASAVLADVLRDLGLAERKGIAAALNGTVVPRADWGARLLNAGDRVLIIRATQGG